MALSRSLLPLLMLAACNAPGRSDDTSTTPSPSEPKAEETSGLTTLDDNESQLRAAFNEHGDHPQLVVILSPT